MACDEKDLLPDLTIYRTTKLLQSITTKEKRASKSTVKMQYMHFPNQIVVLNISIFTNFPIVYQNSFKIAAVITSHFTG